MRPHSTTPDTGTAQSPKNAGKLPYRATQHHYERLIHAEKTDSPPIAVDNKAFSVLNRVAFQTENVLEHFNFEMRGNSRFIYRNRCRSYFPARYFAVDKDILLHLKAELL